MGEPNYAFISCGRGAICMMLYINIRKLRTTVEPAL